MRSDLAAAAAGMVSAAAPTGDGEAGGRGFIRLTPAEARAALAACDAVDDARDEERRRLVRAAGEANAALLRSGWRAHALRWNAVAGYQHLLGRWSLPASPAAVPLRRRIARSGLFAPGWYRREYGALVGAADPLSHFVGAGIAAGLKPNPFFDPAWYLRTHALLMVTSGQSGIEHYLGWGAHQLLAPGPLFDPLGYLARNQRLGSVPDLLAHYLNHGIFRRLAITPVRVPYPAAP